MHLRLGAPIASRRTQLDRFGRSHSGVRKGSTGLREYMRILGHWLWRQVASCLVMCLIAPFAEAATARPQQSPPTQQTQASHSERAQSQNSDSATGKSVATTTQSAVAPDNANSSSSPTGDRNPQSGASQSTSDQQQNVNSKPVGTAAAPYEKPIGVPASRPAGAAIAPAKQKRRRSILIKVAVIVGAAVAIGTVVGLSKASASRP